MELLILNRRKTIIYDGYCTCCNWAVCMIQKADKQDKFEFISRYSDEAKKYNASEIESIILVDGDFVYYKSQAVLKIVSELAYPYRLLKIFKIIPSAWLNVFYDFVASNRKHWFPSNNSCKVTPQKPKS